MTIALKTPRDLMPMQLVYWDSLSVSVTAILEETLSLWQQREATTSLPADNLPAAIVAVLQRTISHWGYKEVDPIIQNLEQVRDLARTKEDWLSAYTISVLLADFYREVNHVGRALKRWKGANDALDQMSGYAHRSHADAVSIYMRALIYHVMGDNDQALEDYQHAIAYFEQAKDHWYSTAARNPKLAERCEGTIEWIRVLSRSAAKNLNSSLVSNRTTLCLPATHAQSDEHRIVNIEMKHHLAWPTNIQIGEQQYHLHGLYNGHRLRFLPLFLAHQYLVLEVQEDGEAGEHSTVGNYVLVRLAPPTIEDRDFGILQDERSKQWKCGKFLFDGGVWTFVPLPHGAEERVEMDRADRSSIGKMVALLKTD